MANRIADTARDEANAPVSGATASLRLIGGGEIDSTTTDAGGFYAFTETEVGYPGPIFVRVTDTNGVSRERTSNSTGKTGTIFMSDLARAFLMMTDGVFAGVGDELAVSADGVTMNLVIDDGMAFLYGHPYYQPGNKTVTVAANGTANPRIDLVVIRLKPPGVSGEGEIVPAIVQGTPAASPTAPGSTQDPATVWEYPLAQILVDPGVSSIAVGKVTDVRSYTSGPLTDSSVTTAKLADLSVTVIKLAANAVTAAKISNETTYSTSDTAKVLKANVTPLATPLWASLNLGELADVAATVPTNGQVLVYETGTNLWKPGSAASGDASTNTATSVDSEVAIFSGTTGKVLKRATLTAGIVKSAAGILSAAAASDLPTGIDATKIADGTVTSAEFQRINSVTSNVQTQLDGKSATTHVHEAHPTLADSGVNDYYSSIAITTTGQDVASVSLTLLDGVTYDCIADADMQAGGPTTTGTWTQAFALIGGGSSTAGTKVGTVGGERNISARQTEVVVGTGAAVTFKARANTNGGTGVVNGAIVRATAIPRNIPAS